MKTLVLLPCLVVACAAQSTQAPKTGAAKAVAKPQVAELQKEIQELQKQNQSLWDAVSKNNAAIKEIKRTSAELDPATPGTWMPLQSDAGLLLVSIDKVEPYRDGCLVELNIGNTSIATFKGYAINAAWTHKKTDAENWPDWFKSEKQQQFKFTDDLVSGRWNKAQLVLSGTRPEDFGFLSVSLSVNTISLGTLLK